MLLARGRRERMATFGSCGLAGYALLTVMLSACHAVVGIEELQEITTSSSAAGAAGSAGAGGGAAGGGGAEPIALVTGQDAPTALALDEVSVYWVNSGDGSVKKVAKTGGQVTVLVAARNAVPAGIVVNGGTVFWSNTTDSDARIGSQGSVLEVPSIGGELTEVADHPPGEPAGAFDPTGIAAYANRLYWTSPDRNAVFVYLPGVGVDELPTVEDAPQGIAADAEAAYWTNRGSGQIVRYRTAGSRLQLATGEQEPWGIAVGDNGYVYWTNRSGDAVRRAPAEGGAAAETVSGDEASPTAIAVDFGVVCWTNQDGTVRMVPTTGGDAQTIADGQGEAMGIAVDSANVYWTSRTAGTVMKVAR